MDKEIIKQYQSAKTIDELKQLASSNGYPLTDEEAKQYFELFHAKGKINDDELNNIVGGACSDTRNGRFYSSNPPHNLITTSGNSCDLYNNGNPGSTGTCFSCRNSTTEGIVYYCTARNWDDDKCNPRYIK